MYKKKFETVYLIYQVTPTKLILKDKTFSKRNADDLALLYKTVNNCTVKIISCSRDSLVDLGYIPN
jgi:hypothetical protein